MTVLAEVTAAVSTRWIAAYFGFYGLQGSPLRENFLAHRHSFFIHTACSTLALAVGPFQFLPNLRKTNISLHRLLGKIYAFSCFAGGISSLFIAPISPFGPVASAGFLCLAAGWLVSNGMAMNYIKKKDILNHRRWMIRSYAFTFSATTFRLFIVGGAVALKLPFETVYAASTFLGWIPNILFAEYYVRTRT
eukprot:TRINITY_DN2025_c0_g1_i3.p1 TRINITY_DN2025_c0_g1~~TRINITY_DN2025_c0_g1_i3.p1  ORF type:complete len:218 (-),score=16.67 TRINITY_DN2025_c0_g1_i3:26-601(-)